MLFASDFIVAAIWLATIALAVISLRVAKRRAILLATISLTICLLFGVVFNYRHTQQVRSKISHIDGTVEERTSGWHIDSCWFFAAAMLPNFLALIAAVRSKKRV